jgi:putative inorganic carbon (HCO3(-)) transporter
MALKQPWVGVMAAYCIAILNPQAIWWWHFETIQGFRPVYMVLLPTLIGFGVAAIRRQLDYGALGNLRIVALAVLWVCCIVSTLAGPYAVSDEGLGIRSAGYVLEVQTKILILLVIGSMCIKSDQAVRVLAVMVALCSIYLVYWANDRFLSLAFVRRLPGPMSLDSNGAYADENNFAVFFVGTLPFLWYLGHVARSGWIKWALWAAIPFGWHAVFLTGSRGGLLGLAAVLLWIGFRSGQRRYGLLLIPFFIAAFVWQGGDTMKERAGTIKEYKEDDSSTGRLNAWAAATRMMVAHPLTGVGPGAFLRAYPQFAEEEPLQAHSTFFQIGGEYGPVAALALMVAIVSSLRNLRLGGIRLLRADPNAARSIVYATNEATLASLIGVLVCSLFLTLQLFELLYFLIFLANVMIRRTAMGIENAFSGGGKFQSSSEGQRVQVKAEGGLARPLASPVTKGDIASVGARAR